MVSPPTYYFRYASIIFGAFFCLVVTAWAEEKPTPDWKESTRPELQNESDAQSIAKKAVKTAKLKGKPVRFLSYNLKNYLTMRRYSNGKASYTSKPEEEIDALVDIIKNAQPDILGVCEIGTPKDLKNLQTRLKQVGVDLPHSHRAYGADAVRALAILSRYPILSWSLPKEMFYKLDGRPFKISRGILDATIQLPGKEVRFLGAHFKSKRPIEDADQELMRRNESMLFRKHIEFIMSQDPATMLIAYGDFNDTKRTKSVYTVKGRSNSKNHMEMLELADSRNENWTHNWKREDIYSRFDYVLVNRNLAPLIDRKTSCILDPETWDKASDHRPLLVLIR